MTEIILVLTPFLCRWYDGEYMTQAVVATKTLEAQGCLKHERYNNVTQNEQSREKATERGGCKTEHIVQKKRSNRWTLSKTEVLEQPQMKHLKVYRKRFSA
jgi:hypothetical protein